MERANSSRASSRKRVLGWYGLGSMRSMSTSRGPTWTVSRAGTTAVPPAVVACGCTGAVSGGAFGSGSRMSAPSPRPSAFLGIGNYLLGELRVPFRPFAMNVVNNDRFPETRRFRQANIARNHALKDLRSKKTAQIRGNLPRKRCPLVIHREQDTLDFKAWIERAPDAHQGIQQLRNAFQGQILTLDRHQHGACSYQRIQCQQVQCGRAVQDDEIVLFLESFQSTLQLIFAVLCSHQLHSGPSKVFVGGDDI